jgi:general L-amino acid transport system permease protein
MSGAPTHRLGAAGWLRANLFSTPGNSVLTVLMLALLAWLVPKAFGWLFLNAVWGPQPVAACDAVRGTGACWAVVWSKFRFMFFGTYPYAEQWRGGLAIAVLCSLLVLSDLAGVVECLAGADLGGGHRADVLADGRRAGLVAGAHRAVGRAAGHADPGHLRHRFAFPLGVVLALGRRSQLPIVRSLSVIYIEVVRGVPLITVLFMASVMFALFMPEGLRIDQLLRAQVAIILFVAAYLAEAVRGGLQAVPKGQYEAAEALGLPFWKGWGW